jgi:hypothetical protein
MSEKPGEKSGDVVESVYALRDAAIDHGLALANLQSGGNGEARDHLLATKVALEEKTAAAIDLCAENADEEPSET